MNTFSLILYALAGICVLWAAWGFFKPQTLYFALPENQTRKNAFFFPLLRLALPLALVARLNSGIIGDINYSWGAPLGIVIAFLWYAGKRAAELGGEYFL